MGRITYLDLLNRYGVREADRVLEMLESMARIQTLCHQLRNDSEEAKEERLTVALATMNQASVRKKARS